MYNKTTEKNSKKLKPLKKMLKNHLYFQTEGTPGYLIQGRIWLVLLKKFILAHRLKHGCKFDFKGFIHFLLS